jgi:hypothetical protein
MKPTNFPARKMSRSEVARLKAKNHDDCHIAIAILVAKLPHIVNARSIRTKKNRGI